MRHTMVVFGLAGLALIGCGGGFNGGSGQSGAGLSKEEAKALGGKSEAGADLCKSHGWYGDGVCDDFCVLPDSDCSDPAATCGGIAGIGCPSGQTCVDDPNDGCDPDSGGADCGGICVEAPTQQACGGLAGQTCPNGQTCVDDPSDECNPAQGGADCMGVCVNESPAPLHCGGLAGTPCPQGQTCADDPSDDCDPAKGGADCLGICVAS